MTRAASAAKAAPHTEFAGGRNPFAGLASSMTGWRAVVEVPDLAARRKAKQPASPGKRRSPVAPRVDLATLTVCNDPPPDEARKNMGYGRLTPLFVTLKYGQCIKCPSAVTRHLAKHLSVWLASHGIKGRVTYLSTYDTVGQGAVWLLEPKSDAKGASVPP